ncbi:unnamed protein product [Aphanomyces euteiches]
MTNSTSFASSASQKDRKRATRPLNMTAVDIEAEDLLQANALYDVGDDIDEAETEEAENGAETPELNDVSDILGKRLNSAPQSSLPNGKRLRQNNEGTVIELGDDDDDDNDDEDEDDDNDTDTSVPRPYSKSSSKQFKFMSKGNRSASQFDQGAESTSQQHSDLQRQLDSMDRKTKTELFSDALELCGAELFQGHEAWRDQLLIKACRLHPAFVSSINELAHQSGSYNTPVVLSGDEDDDDDDDPVEDDTVDDDDANPVNEATSPSGEDDELNLVEDEDDDDALEFGDMSDL